MNDNKTAEDARYEFNLFAETAAHLIEMADAEGNDTVEEIRRLIRLRDYMTAKRVLGLTEAFLQKQGVMLDLSELRESLLGDYEPGFAKMYS